MNGFSSEDFILDSYSKYRKNALKILLAIYQGNYHRFMLSAFFYIIKHSPAWLMPIVIANIVNAVMYKIENPIYSISLNAVVLAFLVLLNIVINITVALAVTIYNNGTIFLFFVLTIPVASLTIVFFRNRIKEQNHKFRKEIELTSAKVMDMEEMIPVTRAHALETIEVKKMQTLVQNVSEEGYRLDIIQANFGSVSWAIFQLFQIGCLVFSGWFYNIKSRQVTLYYIKVILRQS